MWKSNTKYCEQEKRNYNSVSTSVHIEGSNEKFLSHIKSVEVSARGRRRRQRREPYHNTTYLFVCSSIPRIINHLSWLFNKVLIRVQRSLKRGTNSITQMCQFGRIHLLCYTQFSISLCTVHSSQSIVKDHCSVKTKTEHTEAEHICARDMK